ncbi:MAG TPA: tyrosine-type recombinase/integrase [Candidatus Paceibacterota bacterium]|nr:tyrosine-type recombinase/integrase [Verrucomicrobiota bacterium]HSA10352.1 tyrosine-type recombinase/integrase [Candidatus Paceibacterota bacterium]
MAYVWKHPNSPYWTAGFRDEQNRWVKKSTKLRNRTKALALAIEWERVSSLAREGVLTEAVCREVIGGILERVTGEKLREATLREFCAEWLRGKTRSRQDATSVRYGATVKRFCDFLGAKADLPIAGITPRDCQRFYDHLAGESLAPATLVVEMKTIISLFNHARRLGLITTNPATAVELPERIKQVKRQTFTAEQVQLLIDAAKPEWKTAILLGYYGGLRLGDAVALPWSAVSFTGNKLVVETHKTGETLEIPMHPTLEAHLTRLAGDETGAVCPTLAAVPVGGRSGLSKQFLAVMREAGIGNNAVDTGGQRKLSRLSFHALRASFNSTLHNKGVDQELRRKLTGHKSDSVNDRYTQTQMQTLREAVNKLPALKA